MGEGTVHLPDIQNKSGNASIIADEENGIAIKDMSAKNSQIGLFETNPEKEGRAFSKRKKRVVKKSKQAKNSNATRVNRELNKDASPEDFSNLQNPNKEAF